MSVSEAIEALRHDSPISGIHLPDSRLYLQSNASYYSAPLGEIKPAAIFYPKFATEVSQFVKTIQPFVAQGLKLAIRGAGQQCTPGCSNIDGGITLDLSDLDEITVDKQAGVVRVGAGARWEEVYEVLQEHDLGVTGSRSARSGIGGLALSGGLSFFSSREGFICDNVVKYQVVLGSGEIIETDAKSTLYGDLFTALRGGGNNFGIVTRFDLRTFPQGSFWGGVVLYLPDDFDAQIDALVNEITTPNADPETHIMQTICYAEDFAEGFAEGFEEEMSSMSFCVNQVYYTKGDGNPEVLKPFTDIESQFSRDLKLQTLAEAAKEQAGDSQSGVRRSYFNLTVKANAKTLKAARDIFLEEINDKDKPIKDVPGIFAELTFQPYPLSLLEKSGQHGGNSLDLSSSSGPLVSILLVSSWDEAKHDEKVIKAMRRALERIKNDAQGKQTLVSYTNLNQSCETLEPKEAYGPDRLDELQKVAKKHDPEGFFQKGVPGGFKLFA